MGLEQEPILRTFLFCLVTDIAVGHLFSSGEGSCFLLGRDHVESAESSRTLPRRLAANDSSSETRNYYLYMAKNYSTLAEAVELKTIQEAREQRLAS